MPQAYLGAPGEVPAGVEFPVTELAAFDRVYLAAGEGQTVTLHVPLRQLQYWSTKKQAWVTPTGERMLSVGPSSATLPLHEETAPGREP